MKQIRFSLFTLTVLAVLVPPSSATVGTFTLDALSFVSFGDERVAALPAGSTIRFRLEESVSNGDVPFRIEPGDVAFGDVLLKSGKTLRYRLVSAATGLMRRTASGRQIQFTATIRSTLDTGRADGGSKDYTVHFTTESTSASNLRGTESLSVYGMRLVDGVWYGQIVGATTNKADAFPEPEAAVYTVLSGSFDQVP